MSALFFGMTVLAAEYRFGSLDAGRAWFAGAQVFVDEPVYQATYDSELSEVKLNYVIRNLSDVTIPIVGSTMSCSCAVSEGLPTSIEAYGVAEIVARVKIERSRQDGQIRGEIRIYLGNQVQSEILLSYRLKPSEASTRVISNRAASSRWVAGLMTYHVKGT